MITRFINAGIAEHEQHAFGIAVDQLNLRFENRHAGAFTAYQSARQVETAVFAGQELVKVVP